MIKAWFVNGVIKSYFTTLVGLIAALVEVLHPIMVAGRMPTKTEWLWAILMVVGGASAKDCDSSPVAVNTLPATDSVTKETI